MLTVQMSCRSTDERSQIYDNISYCKGASVLCMLCAVVGEDAFIRGTSVYLKKRLYGNSVTQDLWDGKIADVSSDDRRHLIDIKHRHCSFDEQLDLPGGF
jgi:aminopeptidase 2